MPLTTENSYQVNGKDNDKALFDTLHQRDQPHDRDTSADCLKTAVSSPNIRSSLELNDSMLIKLERRWSTGIYDSDSNDDQSDQAVPPRHDQFDSSIISRPSNSCKATISAALPSSYAMHSSSVLKQPSYYHYHPKRQRSRRISRPNESMSKSLPPEKSHGYSKQSRISAHDFNASFCTRKTASTDDTSRFTEGSELLVDWGESYTSSEDENDCSYFHTKS